MAYNYTNGDGPTVLIPAEPANTDSIAATCAQAIRQIKAFINDPVAGIVYLAAQLSSLASTVSGLSSTVSTHTTQINNLNSAVGNINTGKNIFSASPSVDQDIVLAGPGTTNHDITLGNEYMDPDNNFGASIFTVPVTGYYEFSAAVQFSLFAGVPTNLQGAAAIEASDTQAIPLSLAPFLDDRQDIITGSGKLFLNAGATVKLSCRLDTDAACTVRVEADYTRLYGMRVR